MFDRNGRHDRPAPAARRRRTRSCRFAGAAVLLAAPACGDDGPASSEPTAAATLATATTTVDATAAAAAADGERLELPGGVEVFVEFPRYLHQQRRLEVAFDNRSRTELVVVELALDSALFEPVEPERPGSTVEPGRRRDLQIGLGGPRCSTSDAASLVVMTVELDGARRHGTVAVDPAPLARLHHTECGRRDVLAQLDVRYADAFRVDDDVLRTELTLTRRAGSQPATVDAVRGSVLIDLRPAGGTTPTPLATLAAEAAALAVPVELRVTRCDPHAVTESKKTFEMQVWVALGDRPPQHLVVPPEGELRRALEAQIEACLRSQ